MTTKIMMVLPEFYPQIGGTEVQALNLSKQLLRKGTNVTVLTRMSVPGSPKDENVEGIEVHRVDYPRIRLLGGAFLNLGFAWRILKGRKKIDVVHFHIGGSHMLLPFMIAIFLKKKTLLKISGWWEMECGFLRPHGLLPKLMRKLLFKTQYMIAVSAEINLRLRLLGYPPDRILELPNGVDTSKFFCGHKNSGYVRLIFVGRLVTEKDLPTLLEAVSILVKTNSGLSLELVGDGREKSNLKKYVESMGIQKFVTFSGKKDNVAEALRNSDIFVQTSTTEGLPNALLEAMACGLPVVVTNVGGMPDVVKDNHNGFVIDSGNTLQLVERLQLLIHDPELRKKFSDNNLDLMRDNFSLDSVAAKYIEVYSN